MPDEDLKTTDQPDAPDLAPFDAEAQAAVADLVRRQSSAGGVLMKAVSMAGGQVEDGMKLLPTGVRAQIEKSARSALERSYGLAARTREPGLMAQVTGRISTDRAHQVLATISGAVGGFGGLPTALAELPVATTVIFRAVQGVAESYGEDLSTQEARLECLRVFGAGGPGTTDDGVDTTFIGARLSLSGAALNGLLKAVAPRFAAVLGQKLASQSIPVLGAAAGAGTNYAFVGYYIEMAHVHFGLRKLARLYGEDAVLDHFHAVLSKGKVPVNRA